MSRHRLRGGQQIGGSLLSADVSDFVDRLSFLYDRSFIRVWSKVRVRDADGNYHNVGSMRITECGDIELEAVGSLSDSEKVGILASLAVEREFVRGEKC